MKLFKQVKKWDNRDEFMFDYQGYSEEKLLNLCDEKLAYRGQCEWRFWTSEVYSYGRHLRKFAYYPSFLPLYVYSDHGADGDNKIYDHELIADAPYFFFHNPDKIKNFKKKSDKPVNCLLSPFVFYRRDKKIEQLSTAKGTLAFPAHSIPDINEVSSIEDYIKSLKELPEEFQPVCVSLHMHDINKGQHKVFLEHGIPVYTSGNAFDQRFAERFYDILKNFKYTTSNIIGSNVFYSIEMGIPFFLRGAEPKYVNVSNPNYAEGDILLEPSEILKMFAKESFSITPDQKMIVEKGLGINDGISRIETAKILYYQYLKNGDFKADLRRSRKLLSRFLKNKIRRRK